MDWTEILITLITAVIGPAILLLISNGVKLLKVKAESIEDKTMRDALANSINELAAAATAAVREVQETYVKALKDSGEFTDAHGKIAFERAFTRTKEIASDLALETVSIATGNLDAWIKSHIERSVAYMHINDSYADCD